eukprot:CAMPEP_0179002410 /NCGR_PEP_ID=MMETSP0795-20121207/11992_1 /TAXON_ID=88552 /ORGANISM="Amoebophrya sp., Strain Ameob2" /LENGTH=47 /DNA_ID= /DNA_START= /DNA_END= /DNA_ORIENTATION=
MKKKMMMSGIPAEEGRGGDAEAAVRNGKEAAGDADDDADGDGQVFRR